MPALGTPPEQAAVSLCSARSQSANLHHVNFCGSPGPNSCVLSQRAASLRQFLNVLKRLKILMNFALHTGMIDNGPTRSMKGFKVKPDGFHTWTNEDIAKSEARHLTGSKARLTIALVLYTGQRRSDVILMGWQHEKDDFIVVQQKKTKAMLEIPIHPELKTVLDGWPRANMTFLATEYGKRFTDNSFGNKLREWRDDADLPNCSAHSLHKAIRRRMAESDATQQG